MVLTGPSFTTTHYPELSPSAHPILAFPLRPVHAWPGDINLSGTYPPSLLFAARPVAAVLAVGSSTPIRDQLDSFSTLRA